MPSRHLSRVCAFQSIYEWDFRPKASINNIISKNIDKFDAEIVKSAPEWPLEQISRVDKNILRLATYELINIEDIPPKVTIDEAVEIAKTFGSENSSKFVNGVLGTIYRKHKKNVNHK